MDSTTDIETNFKIHVPSLGEPIPLDEHACSVALPKWLVLACIY